MSRRFAFVVAIAFSALVVTSGSSAAPSDLFFSEYIEGTSNNKALEIYNGTGAAIDLTPGATSSRCSSTARATAGLTITLTGTVAAGDVFVLAHAGVERDDPRPGRPDERRRLVQRRRRGRPAQGRHGDDPRRRRPGRRRPGHGVGHRAGEHRRQHAPAQGGSRGRRPRRLETPSTRSLEWDGFATDMLDGLGAHLHADSTPRRRSLHPPGERRDRRRRRRSSR